jgi:small subunit ribosomal protein S2
MKKYIYGKRDGVHIFDLVQTKAGLEKACEFLKGVVASGGVVLYVGTKRQASKIVREQAEKVGMPYLAQRWLAGVLTNYPELKKRVARLTTLKERRESGGLKKYTKKEQLLLDREIAKLEKFFGGVTTLAAKPAALFIVDSHREIVAVKEANKMGVPVVAMVDTNADPAGIDYVIPGNDDAEKAIELVVTTVTEAIKEGLGQNSKGKSQN